MWSITHAFKHTILSVLINVFPSMKSLPGQTNITSKNLNKWKNKWIKIRFPNPNSIQKKPFM